jgi:hypothetical protein
MAVCLEYESSSEPIRIVIPQPGADTRPPVNLATPAGWAQQTKLDDSTAVWGFIERLGKFSGVRAFDIILTAESGDGHENVEYSGALESGYDAVGVKSVAEKLQAIASGGSFRMSIGSLRFPAGQVLLDWLKATNQQFDASKLIQ